MFRNWRGRVPSGRAPGIGVAQYLGRPWGLSQAKLREPIYTQNALQSTILIENIGDEEPFWKQVTIASIDTSEEKCSRQACLINQSTTNVVLFYVAAESRDVKSRFSATSKRISPTHTSCPNQPRKWTQHRIKEGSPWHIPQLQSGKQQRPAAPSISRRATHHGPTSSYNCAQHPKILP